MRKRKRERASRRVYLRFTEREFCLLQRLTVLDGKCIADLLTEQVLAWSHRRAHEDWYLYQWWSDEKFRISLEETQVP